MVIKAKVSSKIKLNQSLKGVRGLLKENIISVIESEVIPALIDKIMEGYDRLSDIAAEEPDDPTNPGNWRADFLAHLQYEAAQIVINRDSIRVQLGDKDFLGYNQNDPHDDTPLHWMVYFIEGLAGSWAFISPDLYEEMRDKEMSPGTGRFGQGFMISEEAYKSEGWARITGVPFSQAKHPFSRYKPTDIFLEAIRELKIRPYINKAIKATAKGERL